MKNKYHRLSKEEQKNARNEYIKRNPITYKKFHKLSITSMIGIIYAVLVLIFDLVFSKTLLSGSFTLNIIIDGFVLIFCLTFYLFSKDTIDRQINKMLVEELRQKQIDKWNKEQAKLKDEVKVDYENKNSNKKTSKKKVTKKTTKKSTSKKNSKKTKE
jgi:predicted PurR-regulated permease PerM